MKNRVGQLSGISPSVSEHNGQVRLTSRLLFLFCALFSTTVVAQVNLNNSAQVPLPISFGDPASVSVSAAVGSVSDRLPIIVPPGRRDLQPQLTLSYNSMGGSGDAGLGWSIGIGRIERWRADGTPSLQEGDRYSYSLGGSAGELRDLDGDGIYRARIESVYRPVEKAGSGWGLYDGNGNYYSFGSSENSRIDGELWMIDRVQDSHGNTITYHYSKGCVPSVPCADPESNALYLSEIKYTGHAPSGDPGSNRVLFEYEDRPDKRFSYLRGVREAKNVRLKRITVLARSDLVRRYEFGYEQYAGGSSLLETVVLIGADDQSRVTLRTLEYGERPFGWANQIANELPLDLRLLSSAGKGTGVTLADVNGDGFADVLGNGKENEEGDGHDKVYLGDGQGGFVESPAWSASFKLANIQFVGSGGIDTGVRLLDLNGDARPDLFIATQTRSEVLLNNGSGWQQAPDWSSSVQGLSSISVATYSSEGCLAAHCDVLGDDPAAGCTPRHCIPEIPADEENGTPAVPADPPGCTIGGTYDGGTYIAVHCDVTSVHDGYADGSAPGCVPDHCEAPASTECSDPLGVFCFGEPTEPEEFALIGEDGQSKGVELADLNGDGLIDIVWSLSFKGEIFLFETPRFVRAVFLNGGDTNPGWHRNDALAASLSVLPHFFVEDNLYMSYSFQDVNGDGFNDIVRSLENEQAIFLGNGTGWEFHAGYTNSMKANGIFAQDSTQKGQGLFPMDFNDDGLLDYVRASVSGEDDREYTADAFVNTGYGWSSSPAIATVLRNGEIAFVTAEGAGTGTTMADINGDGVGDLVVAVEESSDNRIALSSVLRSGKLVRVTSTLGEVTDIDWTSSTRFDNSTQSGIQGLPLAMTVVSRLSRSDGRGNILSTQHNYAGGLFEDRGFRGFAWSENTPSTGLRSVTVFYQDEARATRPVESSTYDSVGNLRSRVTTVLTEVIESAGDLVSQVQLTSIDNERFDSDGGSTHSQVENVYNERLQAVRTTRDAQVGPSGDESTLTRTFARNDTAGIWNLTVRERLSGTGGALLTESVTFYDGLPEGQVQKGLLTESRELVETGVYVSRSFGYDSYGNPISVQDREGGTTTFTYDAATITFRTSSTDALGRVKRSDYDPRFGTLVRDANASGNETTTEYDAFGRISRVVSPGDETSEFGTTSFIYSALGNPDEQFIHMLVTENAGTDEVYESTTMFDALGNVYESYKEGSEGRTIVHRVEFDDAGRPHAASMPFFVGDTPVMLSTQRDDLGRPLSIVDPLGQSVSYTYKSLALDFEDSRGFKTSVAYTPDGNTREVRRTVDGEEHITRYAYDVQGRLTKVTDALGNETRIQYDALGRRTRMEDPNSGNFQYRYDGEGRLVEQTGPDGKTMRLMYSAAGELIEKELPDGTIHVFRYGGADAQNAVGELIEVEDAAGILRFSYDARGNVTERRRTVGDRTYVTGFSYDSLDRIRRVTYPDGFHADYAYDEGGNLASITGPDGRPLADDFEYNAEGRYLRFGYGNGVDSGFTYDVLGRMLSTRTSNGKGKDIQELVYSFDAASNVEALNDLVSGASQQFEYDEANRLVHALGPYGEETYEYDAIDNLVRKGDLHFAFDDPLHPQRVSCGVEVNEKKGKGKPSSSAIDSCAASMASINPAQIARAFALSYDERGNVVRKGARSYEYDAENRLLGVREANGRLLENNLYDTSGELIVQATQSETRVFIDGLYEEGKTHVSRHVYAGPLLVATLVTPRTNVVLIESASETNGSFYNRAGVSVLGLLLMLLIAVDRYFSRRISRGLAGVGRACRAQPGQLMLVMLFVLSTFPTATLAGNSSQGNNEQRYYYHANHLGSVNVVTDDDGHVTARRDYRPFGDQHDWSGSQAGPRELLNTFQGQKFDDNTGLYYFKARHYDSELGRFMSADTIVADINDPKTLNRYAFAGGNPVNFIDPTGHSFLSVLSDIGDAFESAGEWIADNAVEIAVIVGVGVLLIGVGIFTGGTGTLLGLALIGGGVGFGVGGGIALGLGYGVEDAEFWGFAGIGAGLGALGAVGFGGASVNLGWGTGAWGAGLTAKGTFAVAVAKGAFVGGVAGGFEGFISGVASGASADEAFVLFAKGAGIGAGIGAIGGGLGAGAKGLGAIGKGLGGAKGLKYAAGLGARFVGGLGSLVNLLAKPYTGGKIVYATLASRGAGSPTVLDPLSGEADFYSAGRGYQLLQQEANASVNSSARGLSTTVSSWYLSTWLATN